MELNVTFWYNSQDDNTATQHTIIIMTLMIMMMGYCLKHYKDATFCHILYIPWDTNILTYHSHNVLDFKFPMDFQAVESDIIFI